MATGTLETPNTSAAPARLAPEGTTFVYFGGLPPLLVLVVIPVYSVYLGCVLAMDGCARSTEDTSDLKETDNVYGDGGAVYSEGSESE